MLTELVYPLNINSSIYDIIPEIEKYKIKEPGVKLYSPDILDPKWKIFEGVTWDYISIFYKANNFRPKVAHIDIDEPENNKSWSINIHLDGAGLLEIYNFEDIIRQKRCLNGTDCSVHGEPMKSYYMPEGAYLINSFYPHRATGYGERFCVSLRSRSTFNIEFEDIYNKFKDYIIDKPLLTKAPD